MCVGRYMDAYVDDLSVLQFYKSDHNHCLVNKNDVPSGHLIFPKQCLQFQTKYNAQYIMNVVRRLTGKIDHCFRVYLI